MINPEDYEDYEPPVRQPKPKQRPKGALTNLLVYGQNRRNGALNVLKQLRRDK